MIRLNKYLSDCGICSRREADRLMAAGAVTVDGSTVLPGAKINGGEEILCNGRRVCGPSEKVVLAYNKPVGIVCTTKDQGHAANNIIDAVGFAERVYPVGRLDKDSSGLILLTNDGELMDRVLRSRNGHEKEYEVTVDRPVKDEILKAISAGGIQLDEDRASKPCTIKRTGSDSFNIILTEGMNREIRRLCEWFDYKVVTLRRIRFMNIRLDGLAEGKYRRLSDKETEGLGGL